MNEIDKNELRELFIEIKHNNKIAYEKLYSKYKKLVYGILGMFIITFVVGIKTLFKQSIEQAEASDEDVDESVEDDISQPENAEIKSEETLEDTEERQETLDYADQNTIEQEETTEEIQIENNQETNINSYGIGILSISAIFLILTVIFSIFLIKRQLNSKNKTSK